MCPSCESPSLVQLFTKLVLTRLRVFFARHSDEQGATCMTGWLSRAIHAAEHHRWSRAIEWFSALNTDAHLYLLVTNEATVNWTFLSDELLHAKHQRLKRSWRGSLRVVVAVHPKNSLNMRPHDATYHAEPATADGYANRFSQVRAAGQSKNDHQSLQSSRCVESELTTLF